MAERHEIPQWQRLELTFTASVSPASPLDSALTATFRGPGGQHYRVCGFCDGKRTWKVRFTPTAAGRWTFCTTSIDPALHGQTGRVWVTRPTGHNPLYRHGGFIKVADNQRYLTYADGTPFFWLGDTWWFCPSNLVPFDRSNRPEHPAMYKALIQTRKAQGYSVIHMAFLGDSGVDGGYASTFQGELDLTYWQSVDRYLDYANEEGMIPIIGFGFHQGMNAPTLDQFKMLWRYVLARYGAHAVAFLICGEYNQEKRTDGQYPPPAADADRQRVRKLMELGQFIKANDPYRRAMTVHPWWHGGDKRQAWSEPWYDFVMFQAGHSRAGAPASFYLEAYHNPQVRPLLEGEATYEGILGLDDTAVRSNAYKAINSGCFGYTYGAHGLWYPNQDENDTKFSDWGAPVPWWQALARPGGAQMKHLRTCYESTDWWRLEPVDPQVALRISPVPADGPGQTPSIKADGDDLFIIYFPDQAEPRVQALLRVGPTAAAYSVTLFNPRTGESKRCARRCRSQDGLLDLPSLPDTCDWVMIVRKVVPQAERP